MRDGGEVGRCCVRVSSLVGDSGTMPLWALNEKGGEA